MGGAGNPYVLAEHRLGKKIDWDNHSSLKKKQTLESAFRMPYEKIFSAEHKSPLFSAAIKKKRGSKHD